MVKYKARTLGFAAFMLLTLICVILFGSYIESGKVFAADITGTTEGGLYYKIEHGEAAITGYQGEDQAIQIPDEITVGDTHYPVTVIGSNAFSYNSSIISVVIPDTVTSIGREAFAKLGIQNITIPDSVTYIGPNAFWGCSSLPSVNIPPGVTRIEDGTFSDCSSLSSVSIPSNVTYIGSSAFGGCSSIQSINIPSGVTSIGARAFLGCTSIQSISIPSGVTRVEDGTFSDCSSLSSVSIPSNVTYIGSSAFGGCSSIQSINIPSSVTYIGYSAFADCSSILSISIPSGVKAVESNTFGGCENLSALVLSEGVEQIGASAFYGCTSLTAITIPATVKYIGDYAFYNCSSVREIALNESLEEIGTKAFYGCDFNRITIPKTVRRIGEEAMGVWLNAAGQSKVIDGFTITGYTNSAASIYADKYQIDFEPLGELKTISGISFTPSDGSEEVILDITSPELELAIDDEDDEDDEMYCGVLKVTSLATRCNVKSSDSSVIRTRFWNNDDIDIYALREGTANITISVEATDQYEAQTIVIPVTVVKDTGVKPVTRVELYENSVSLIIGDRYWLGYNIIPRKAANKNVTWSSNNESVATVDGDGKVTAISAGTAVITVTTEDGGFTDTCTVNVAEVLPNQPTSGKLGPNAYWKYDSDSETMTVYGSGYCEDGYSEGEYRNYRRVTTNLIIEEGITEIDSFSNFTAIESVVFPKSLERFDDEYGAFNNCNNLKSISFEPGSEIRVIAGAFNNCSQLSSVTFPAGTKLDWISGSFEGSAVENLVIPSIEELYLGDNDKIKSVTINGGMIKPTAGMFSGCSNLSNLTIAGFNVKNGIVYNSSSTALICNAFGNGEVTVPDSVVAIQRDAFDSTTGITKLTIPASVRRIDDEAFDNRIVTTSPNFKIAGYENTEAQYYALGKNIPFVSLGKSPLSDNEEIAALQKQLAQLTAEVAALKNSGGDSSGGASGGSDGASAQMISALESQIKELKSKVDSLEKTTSAEKIASLQSEIDSLKNTVDNLKKDSSAERISSLEKLVLKLSKVQGVKASSKAKKTITLKWKVFDYINLDGYQVYFSTKKSSGYKLAGKTGSKTSYTIKKGLKTGTTYYVKVRGFKKYDGKKIYTSYSKPVRVKAK